MKIICVGKNYDDHIEELNAPKPNTPILFIKPDTAIHNLELPYYIPTFTNDLQHEVEIIIKINQNGKHIAEKFANKYYDQIGLGIDFTARDVQQELKKEGLPWEKAKAFDGAAIIGNFIDKKTFPDIENIAFRLEKNGKIVQQSNSNQMIWKINQLISEISKYFTLRKGDIIFTGTPAGVANVQPNDVLKGFLENNESFRLEIK